MSWQKEWKRRLRDIRRRRNRARRKRWEKEREAFAQEQEREQKLNDSFLLQFRFSSRQETDLDKINGVLARLELSDLEIEKHSGYQATQTRFSPQGEELDTRLWYGLDECVLRCTYATPQDRERYQISTMVFDKTVEDCEAYWCEANPDRVMRSFILMECDKCYAAIVAHHDRLAIEAPKQAEESE